MMLPLVAPPVEKLVPEQEDPPVEDQERVVLLPVEIMRGSALISAITQAGGLQG